jgi:hypothetical protein
MATRNTASRIATVAAVAVASMGASLANAAPSGDPTARSGSVLVFVFGGSAFTFSVPFSFSPILQEGGAG